MNNESRKEQWKEMLPLIQAFIKGKQIQLHMDDGRWLDISDPTFCSARSRYRIKPQKRKVVYTICRFKSGNGMNGPPWVCVDREIKTFYGDQVEIIGELIKEEEYE